MNRGETGKKQVITGGSEGISAFIPSPLPPVPPLLLDGPIQLLLEQSLLALGRLDSLSTHLPDPSLFIYAYVRKEAVLSSQIEGTQSSLSDLLLFEMEQAPGVPVVDDVVEVSNYVRAMDHGLSRLRGGFPLSTRLIREIHEKLLTSGRGSGKDPGMFRRTQNWIGGNRPEKANFIPPPHSAVADCMSGLERFLHGREGYLPAIIKAALAHVQFETIHPFLDGNGRVGRLLITLLLCHAGVLHEPLLYLSLYLKQNRGEYYRLLNQVRKYGDWEAWVAFFLEGVIQTGEGAAKTTRRLLDVFQEDKAKIQKQGRKAGSALRVHDALKARPVSALQAVAKRADLSFPAATAGMDLLVKLGIGREVTGKKRNRVFTYGRYLSILSEGTEGP